MSGTPRVEALGGEQVVWSAVNDAYRAMLRDPLVSPFFDGIDLGSQIEKLYAFLAVTVDGRVTPSGRSLGEAHRRLRARGLSDAHFDAVVGHLRTALQARGADEAALSEVTALLGSLRTEILGP